jgi:flagellar FliL protein
MAKTEKPTPAASQNKDAGQDAGANEGAKPKKKKLLLIAVGVLALAIAGGAGWYFTKGSGGHADAPTKKAATPKLEQPKFIPLEAFTVNLQREEGDQFLQVGITLKIDDPALEEKIKLAMPEIRSRLLLLLSGKRASELAPVSGKKKLAQEVIQEVNGALGLRKPPAQPAKTAAAKAEDGNAGHADAASAPAEDAPAEEAPSEIPEDEEAAGILDVLFTSFIIQ